MLQRIQTLFLLGVVIIAFLIMYLPIYELIKEPTISTDLSTESTDQFTVFNNAILAIINGAIGLLALVAIFLFKNRNLQIRACNLALLIDCIFIGLLFFSADTMSSTLRMRVHYLYGSYLPIINAVFLFLAVRFIKRDEELIRSANRLR